MIIKVVLISTSNELGNIEGAFIDDQVQYQIAIFVRNICVNSIVQQNFNKGASTSVCC